MKIPKNIDKALKERTKFAQELLTSMSIVDDWLDAHNVKCEEYDTHTGCEIYVNPYASEQRIREAIRKA